MAKYEPYICTECGAEGCRLWRHLEEQVPRRMVEDSNTATRAWHHETVRTKRLFCRTKRLFCGPCGRAIFGLNGLLDHHLRKTTRIGDLVPAVPVPTGGFYHFATRIPERIESWWLALPTCLDACVMPDGQIRLIDQDNYVNTKRIADQASTSFEMFAYYDLTPPDLSQCQAEVPNNYSFMTLGGQPGTRSRCVNMPVVIATEKRPGSDGKRGSMSLCERCWGVFKNTYDDSYASIRPAPKPRSYPDTQPDPALYGRPKGSW